MNYFEILNISESETDLDTIDAAYTQARIKWQTVLAQGVGEQQREARTLLNGKLEEIYLTLRNPSSRQQYLRERKLVKETGIPLGNGRAKVSFSLNNGYNDHDFLVVENPVRYALETDGLVVDSLQEYVCRAWENSDWALQHVEERVLQRWLYYAAAQKEIVNAVNYLQWKHPTYTASSALGVMLDLIQTKYPAPILPRSPGDLLEKIQAFEQPQWYSLPQIINFGVISSPEEAQATLAIRWWQKEPEDISATVDHQAIMLDTSRLTTDHILSVSVDLSMLERGETVQALISIACTAYGTLTVPVFAVRAKRFLGNQELRTNLHGMVGETALQICDNVTAAHYLVISGEHSKAIQAELAQIQQAYDWHDWHQVIGLCRRFHERYGRINLDVQLWLIEALRMVSGAIYQLNEYRRSLEYLAALAYETSQFTDKEKLDDSWTGQPEAQLTFEVDDPRSNWVAIAEHYHLNWTHAGGRANGSNYAGEVPLDLSARRLLWRNDSIAVQAPLIAYEGVLVGRTRSEQHIVGLDAASGQVIWSFCEGMTGSKVAEPVAGNGMVYTTDPGGTAYALDIDSGKVKWQARLGEGRDISLVYDDNLLFAGTGKRFVVIDTQTGQELASVDEMRSLWMDANPVNLLVTNHCCLFQKVGGVAPSMVFVDLKSGKYLEFELPFVGHSLLGSIGRSLFGFSKNAAITWAAWGEIVVIPYLVSKEIECKQQYTDADGRKKENVERQRWQELHFFVYGVHFEQQLAHVMEVITGTAYKEGRGCKVSITNVQAAQSCAITATIIEETEDSRTFGLPDTDQFPHLLVAAAFDNEIFYWAITDESVKRVGYRVADGPVQSIAFLGLYDMVTTQNSLMTSFIGNLKSGNATAFVFPEELPSIVGAPAIYGDIIYVTTKSGEVIAIGR